MKMDFEEFLWANNDYFTMSVIKDSFEKRKPLGDAQQRKVMQTFRTYMAVGGMPQAVEAYTQGKTYAQIDFIKCGILDLYEEDLYKDLIFDQLGINQGMIIENVVAQMLKATGHELYFHEFRYQEEGAAKEKKYEIDFMIVKRKKSVQ